MYGYHKKQYHRLCICLLSVIFSISCPVYAADTLPSSDTLSAHNTLLLDTAQSLSTMTDRTEEMKKFAYRCTNPRSQTISNDAAANSMAL